MFKSIIASLDVLEQDPPITILFTYVGGCIATRGQNDEKLDSSIRLCTVRAVREATTNTTCPRHAFPSPFVSSSLSESSSLLLLPTESSSSSSSSPTTGIPSSGSGYPFDRTTAIKAAFSRLPFFSPDMVMRMVPI